MTSHPSDEFEGIFENAGGTRPVMTPPPSVQASMKFIRQVEAELEIEDRAQATRIADWAANKLHRITAFYARPVFDMEGNGPQCSACEAIWPLCGCSHLSSIDFKDGGDA